MADNRFSKRIILLNKEKVCSSTNAKSDRFFTEIVVFNVLLLWSCKEVILQATSATSYSNCHFLVSNLLDVSLLVKYIINNSIFKKKLGRTVMPNNTAISTFSNFYYIGSAHLSNGIVLSRYIDSTQGN